MTIANIILSSQNGGAEQVFLDYTSILQQSNYPVCAFIRHNAPYYNKLKQLNIEVGKAKNNFGYYDWFFIWQLRKFLLNNQVKMVIAHSSKATAIAKKAISTIKHKIFLISVNHSYNIKRSLLADLIFSVNRQIMFKTIDAGRSVNNSIFMPNAINFMHHDLLPWQDFTNKKTIVLGVMARMVKEKGIINAIKSIALLTNNSIQFLLKIAGDGPEMSNLQQEVQKLNLQDRVMFLGWCQEKEFYEQIDIFLMPSLVETFGLVMLAAIKYGKPVITTNTDGAIEIFGSNNNAAIFIDLQQNIAEQFVNSINNLTKQPGLAQNLVNNSQYRLCNHFSFSSLQQNLNEVIGQIYQNL
jgi:glycosyltransferase involved in cell wall biosynthesis